MKKVLKSRLLLSVILIFVTFIILLVMVGCEQKETKENDEVSNNNENISEFDETGTLVVYGYTYYSGGPGGILKHAVNYYKTENKNVEVEYKEFEINDTYTYDQHRDVLMSEILAGQGPDLIVGDKNLFKDIYKIMDSGVFYDLNEIIKTDNSFNLDLYNEVVMDSGVYKGKRYIIPIDYTIWPIMTLNETLDEEEISFDEFTTLSGFLGEVNRYVSNNKDNPNKYVSINNFNMTTYLIFSGINYIDYENQTVDFSSSDFKNIMETTKNIYSTYTDKPIEDQLAFLQHIYSDNMNAEITALQSGEILYLDTLNFIHSNILKFYHDYGGLTNDSSPEFTLFPNTNGGNSAVVEKFAGIRQTSENKKNAYDLLKMLLSYDVQTAETKTSGAFYDMYIPISKSAAKKVTEYYWKRIVATTNGTIIWEPVSEEVHNQYLDMILNIDSCVLPNTLPVDEFIYPGLEPYFKGEKTYENCIDDITQKLRIYLSE